MDATTTNRLAKIDCLRHQRSVLGRAIADELHEIRRRRQILDALFSARDVLTERHNAERAGLIESTRLAEGEVEGDADGVPSAGPTVDVEALVRPAIVQREQTASLALYLPGREPLRVAVPAGQEQRAETLVLGFAMLFPAPVKA